MDFGIAGVAAITVIAYAVGQAMRALGRLDRWIPTVCAALGGALGVAGLYIMPGFPAGDAITAAAIGVVSGLAATGVTTIEDAHYIERGYEDIIGKLRGLGADIRRIERPDAPPKAASAG